MSGTRQHLAKNGWGAHRPWGWNYQHYFDNWYLSMQKLEQLSYLSL